LFLALIVVVIGRAIAIATPLSIAIIGLAVLMLITYGLGSYLSRQAEVTVSGVGTPTLTGMSAGVWLLTLSTEWAVLVWLIPEAAYLVFALSFLYLYLLRRRWGILAVLVAVGAAIVALGMHDGWSVAAVIGPLLGAGVAILIGLGYQSLTREAAEREMLMTELMATRDQLAETERTAGALAERARLAREIHDTVAQGLSSIQMLLHAAERADPDRAGIQHIRLARDTAAANLADTRAFIRELLPVALTDRRLAGALRRLAETQWSSDELDVQVRVSDALELPMQVQSALLRITQGAMANVLQHARARTVIIAVAVDADSVELTVADDGVGFDTATVRADRAVGASDSFGLTAIRERVDQFGGTLTVEASEGRGTRLTVVLSTEEPT